MPRPKRSCPSYLLHKPTGQARVRIQGRDFYLGTYNSPESLQRYRQLLAECAAPADRVVTIVDGEVASVAVLAAKYVSYAEDHYRRNKDALYLIRSAVAPLVELYGTIAVSEFSPKKLKALREHVIAAGNRRTKKPLSRKYINEITAIVRRMFKWGVSEELVPVTVYQALAAVDGLQKGRHLGVAECSPVTPVPEGDIPPVLESRMSYVVIADRSAAVATMSFCSWKDVT